MSAYDGVVRDPPFKAGQALIVPNWCDQRKRKDTATRRTPTGRNSIRAMRKQPIFVSDSEEGVARNIVGAAAFQHELGVNLRHLQPSRHLASGHGCVYAMVRT